MVEAIVVGAGPTGLLLAGDLAEAGVSVRLLERRDGEVSNLSRAFGVHARTMEMLDARGVAEQLEETGVARLTHGRLFEHVQVDFGHLASRFPYLLITPQYNVEHVLRERALRAGVQVEYGVTVVGVRQDEAGRDDADEPGVAVDVTGPDDESATHRADYVVGADGIHSAVRTAIDLPFPGKSVLKSIMLADVRLREEPPGTLTVNGTGDEFAFLAPFGDGWWRIFCWDRRQDVPEDEPLSLEEVRAITVRALGSDYGMHEARWLSRFHSDERQAPAYRVGRVFLAGDAAHCHSPAGGLGMNTGLQDAANLSWKLASVLRGAPEELLDTYQDERHRVGREVLRISGMVIRMAMLRPRPARWLRGMIGGTMMRIPAVHRRLLGRLSGIGIDYPEPHGTDRMVGNRIGDLDLADGTRLYEALRGGRFALLAGADVVDDLTAGFDDRVRSAVPGDGDPIGLGGGDGSADGGGRAVLVRPDGYVGAVFDRPDRAVVHATLSDLCGAPSGSIDQ